MSRRRLTGMALLIFLGSTVLLCTSPRLFSGPDKLVIENRTRQQKIALPIPAGKSFEVSYIHSLYGGIQIESFTVGEDRKLYLREMKFENYDALLYYVCFNVENEYFAEPYWVIPSTYVTDSVNFILPQQQRDFKVSLKNRVVKGEEIGSPGDIVRIYLE